MNSGADGAWLAGSWAGLTLPVAAWRVWCASGVYTSALNTWDEVPDQVLAVCVYHDQRFRTFMDNVDEYPDPSGIGASKLGVQLGPVDSAEWITTLSDIRSPSWQPPIT